MAVETSEQVALETLQDKATRLRIDSVLSTTEAGSGHPTSCASAAEIVAVLFYSVMRNNLDVAHLKSELLDRSLGERPGVLVPGIDQDVSLGRHDQEVTMHGRSDVVEIADNLVRRGGLVFCGIVPGMAGRPDVAQVGVFRRHRHKLLRKHRRRHQARHHRSQSQLARHFHADKHFTPRHVVSFDRLSCGPAT